MQVDVGCRMNVEMYVEMYVNVEMKIKPVGGRGTLCFGDALFVGEKF